MFTALEDRAGGPVAAARMLGIPYTSSYAAYKANRRLTPTYINFAMEALLMLPNARFCDLLESRNVQPQADRPWVVLYEGRPGAISPNGVVYSGSRYETESMAEDAARKLKSYGIKGAAAKYRPNEIDLVSEPALS